MTLLDEIEAFKQNVNPLIPRYKAYIADKTIPLEDRMAVFRAAPYEWKDHQSWIVHFDSEKLLEGGEIFWYDDFYVERHETVDVYDFIVARLDDWLTENDYEPEDIAKIMTAFKEEMLEKNLGSFVFDW